MYDDQFKGPIPVRQALAESRNAVAVWIGFDDNRPLGEQETGGRTALPIFREIMLRVDKDQLVGRAPHFSLDIEDGIDQSLATPIVVAGR